MKLTLGKAYNIYSGLSQLDQQEAKLTGETRLKIAINLNRLRPLVEAFERTQRRLMLDIVGPTTTEELPNGSSLANATFAKEMDGVREQEQECEFRTLLKPELRLEDNPKITGTILSLIWPVLEGVDG